VDQTALAELLGSDQKSARVTFVRIGEEGAIVENQVRARIFKLSRSPRIDSKESIPPAGPYDKPIPTRFLAPTDCLIFQHRFKDQSIGYLTHKIVMSGN
jgi:hypothetical protein